MATIKVFYFTFLTIILVSCSTKTKSVNEEDISLPKQVINSELVDDFAPTNSYLDSVFKIRSFITAEEFNVIENHDTLVVLLKQLSKWVDPGDFIRVVIKNTEGDIVFDEVNIDGWVKFGNNYDLPDSVLAKNLLNSDKALLVNNATGLQLVIFGWIYASQPGLMTIIDLFPEPTIMFNSKFSLSAIDDANDYIILHGSTPLEDAKLLNTKTMEIN